MNAIDLNWTIQREKGIFFVPFSRGHLSEMSVAMPELRLEAGGASMSDIIFSQASLGLSTTVVLNGKPVAIFGAVTMWHGVSEAWAVFDDAARTKPKQMLKIGKQFMDIVAAEYDLHRLQIYVRCDDNRARRYAEALGFSVEGIMKCYTQDKCNSFLMARF